MKHQSHKQSKLDREESKKSSLVRMVGSRYKTMPESGHFVYAHCDPVSGEVKYVGETQNIRNRFKDHDLHNPRYHTKDEFDERWYAECSCLCDRIALEAYLINTLFPKYNKKGKQEGSPRPTMIPPEVKWVQLRILASYGYWHKQHWYHESYTEVY